MNGPRSKLACWVLLCAILLITATASPAHAEDPAPPSPWSFQIVPYLWLAGIGGDISGPRSEEHTLNSSHSGESRMPSSA